MRTIASRVPVLVLVVVQMLGGIPPAFAQPALAQRKNCMGCHAVDRKVVGPAYRDVAKKYAAQAGAVDKLAEKVRQGGAGVWGPVPMPANTQVSPAEAKQLVQWILTLQ